MTGEILALKTYPKISKGVMGEAKVIHATKGHHSIALVYGLCKAKQIVM